MTKTELIQRAFDGYTEKERGHSFDNLPSKTMVAGCFDSLCDVMAAELLGGGEVPLPGIGKLKAKKTAARKGRNPRTGESVDIPAGKRVRFVACKELKEALKQ